MQTTKEIVQDLTKTKIQPSLEDQKLSEFNDSFSFQEPSDQPNQEPQSQPPQRQQKQHQQSQNSKQKQLAPNFSEIQRCMGLVSNLMPQMFPVKVVNLFYNKLMVKFSNSAVIFPDSFRINDNESIVKIESGIQQMQEQNNTTMTQPKFIPEEQNRNKSFSFTTTEKTKGLTQRQLQERKLLRKVIAQAFCKGKGYEGAKVQIAKQLPNYTFNSTIHDQILQQVLLETQQHVQQMVIEGYGREGKVVCSQHKAIQRVMAGCRYILSSQICNIIFKAVQEYCFQGIIILMSKEEGMRMLNGINEGLKKNTFNFIKPKSQITQEFQRKKQLRLKKNEDVQQPGNRKYKFELHRLWNSHFQKLMLDMCRAGAQFTQIRERFTQCYPRQKDIFTLNALRGMFFKILRMAVRRLVNEYKQKRDILPELTKMEDQLVKNIINCSECAAIRKKLIDIYMTEVCGKAKLSQIIQMINRYAQNGGGLKKSAVLPYEDEQD